MLGLVPADSGRVRLSCGGAVPGPGLGFMPQSPSLHSYFSVLEILQYYARLGGLPPHLTSHRISSVLQFLDLTHKVSGQWSASQLSGEVSIKSGLTG